MGQEEEKMPSGLIGLSSKVTSETEDDSSDSTVTSSKDNSRNVERPYDTQQSAFFYRREGESFLYFFEEESKKYPTIADLQKEIARDPENFAIRYLRKISPFASKVINATLDTAFADGEIAIAVYDKKGNFVEKDTEELKTLFDSQAPDVGKLPEIATKLLLDFMYFGKGCCFEGVTSDKRLGGYTALYPFSSRSIEFGQRDSSSDFGLYQEQLDPESGARVKKALNAEHIYWTPNQPTIENPFGTSAIPAAMLEAFGEAIVRRDLKDGIQNAGNPTHVFKYDSGEIHKTAVEKLRKKGNDLREYVLGQIQSLRDYAKKYRATDNVVVDTASSFERIPGGNFNGLESAIQMVWTALSASLNSFPAMLGFGDVSKTNINYQFFAGNVRSSRAKVQALLEAFGEKHFRLKGKVRTVCITFPTIHLTDEIVMENTMQLRIFNQIRLYLAGLISEDELSVQLTGKKPVRPLDREMLIEIISASSPSDKNNSKKSGGNDTNDIGGGVTGKPKKVEDQQK